MAIYRGAGGSGDATQDAASEVLLALAAKDAAVAAQVAAEAAQAAAQTAETNAETAETNAETAETNAETAETNAETAATNAASSASAASTSATNAAASASTATTQATNASNSASSASTSASNASTSATNAASSASTATTQATNASNSASAAATSATNAANSATAAQTARTAAELAETNAETAETNAETAETNAVASASAASTSATNASNSASAASTSATNASNSASAASTSATNAATSATNASNSASSASTSATNASNSASSASTSATNAANSATSAANSATAAAASAASINLSSIAITGGTINGTTIGATTASTGKFTTLEATGVATFSAGTVSLPSITTTGDTNTGIFFPAADTIAFTEGGVESMRIDSSGNVGIGNSIPSTFNSFANKLVIGNGSADQGLTIYTGTTNVGTLNFADGTSGSALYQGYIQYVHSTDAMNFYVNYAGNTSPRMSIDSSGNVGIGTSSPSSLLTVKGEIRREFASNTALYTTVNYDGISVKGAQDAYYLVDSGRFQSWYTGASERMRITSGGQVLINTTTTGSTLTVDTKEVSYTGGIDICNSTQWGYGSSINFRTIPTDGGSLTTVSRIQQSYESSNNYMLIFSTYNSGLSERMRITSGGFLKASNTGTYFSTTDPYHELRTNQDFNVVVFSSTKATGNIYGPYISFTGQSPNNTTSYFLQCADTVERATIRSNGGLANYSANDVNLSDRREKTNFAPAKSYLDTICSIPVQTFNYIDQNLEEDGGLTLGVVAQDVQSVAPELVMESNWAGKDQPEKMRLSIYQTDLQYALMKCIQELKAELDTVKAELQTLKGN